MTPPVTRLSAGGLCVGFEHRGDRFAHFVELDAPATDLLTGSPGESPARLWESIEGTASNTWPASPALQSLHVEERPAGVRVALLVGMAGSSHWSMSVEADPARGQLTFDVACRTRDRPTFMGSSYRFLTGHQAVRQGDACWQWSSGQQRLKLEIDAAASEAAVDWQPERLTITAQPTSASGATTYRWRYRLRRAE